MKGLLATLLYVAILSPAKAQADANPRQLQALLGQVTAVELVNSATGAKIKNLVNGDVFDLSTLGMSTPTFNINAAVSGTDIRSTKFGYNSNTGYRVENTAPYAFCGNDGPVFRTCSVLGIGQHTVTVTPYSASGASGLAGQPVTVTFTITRPTPAPISVTAPVPTVSVPVPTPVTVPVPTPVTVPSPPTSCTVPKLVGSWQSGKKHPFPVAEAQGSMIGTSMLIVGGFLAGYNSVSTQTNSLDTSNPNAVWVRQDDYPFSQGITHGAFVVVGTKFYICGGYAGGGIGTQTDVCMVYDHSKPKGTGQQWSLFTPLPDNGRAGGHMIHDSTLNALVYSGGATRPIPNKRTAVDHTDTWMYSLSSPSLGWVKKADMPFHANHMSAVTAKDDRGKEHHYFTGGQVEENEANGNVKDHYEYDTINDIWYKRAFMPIPRSHHASSTRAIGCGFILVAGATNGGQRISDISYYDVPTDTWTKIGDLSNNMNTPVCDMSNGVLYCNTGWDSGAFSKKIQITL